MFQRWQYTFRFLNLIFMQVYGVIRNYVCNTLYNNWYFFSRVVTVNNTFNFIYSYRVIKKHFSLFILHVQFLIIFCKQLLNCVPFDIKQFVLIFNLQYYVICMYFVQIDKANCAKMFLFCFKNARRAIKLLLILTDLGYYLAPWKKSCVICLHAYCFACILLAP